MAESPLVHLMCGHLHHQPHHWSAAVATGAYEGYSGGPVKPNVFAFYGWLDFHVVADAVAVAASNAVYLRSSYLRRYDLL
jgi:hypothetical protein